MAGRSRDSHVQDGERLMCLGAPWRVGASGDAKRDAKHRSGGQPMRFWRVRGRSREKSMILHMSVFPVLSWCAGAWFQVLSRCTACSCRSVDEALQLWPYRDKSTNTKFERSARWCEGPNLTANMPRWDTAMRYGWWRCAGRVDRLSTQYTSICVVKVACWRGAMHRATIRGLRFRHSDPERRWLVRGFRERTGRRLGDAMQNAIGMHKGWRETGEQGVAWSTCKGEILNRTTRQKTCARLAPRVSGIACAALTGNVGPRDESILQRSGG